MWEPGVEDFEVLKLAFQEAAWVWDEQVDEWSSSLFGSLA